MTLSNGAQDLPKSYQVLHVWQVLFGSIAEALPKGYKVCQMQQAVWLGRSYQGLAQVLPGLTRFTSLITEVLSKWHKACQMLRNAGRKSYQGLIWWSSSSPPSWGFWWMRNLGSSSVFGWLPLAKCRRVWPIIA